VRRPTINFSEWVFSVDLEGTREIQGQTGTPAYECNCDACRAWRYNYSDNLSEELAHSFERIGIDLSQPTECYGSQNESNSFDLRVLFHFIGKIRSGPDATTFDKRINDYIMNYVAIRKEPWLSIMVLPCRNSFEARPKRLDGSESDIVCIDMRLSLQCGD
jgi:hypothetical protein